MQILHFCRNGILADPVIGTHGAVNTHRVLSLRKFANLQFWEISAEMSKSPHQGPDYLATKFILSA